MGVQMSKRTRQQAIIDIVSSQRVASQAALADELKMRGFDVTQATLSRDIAELNLVKSKEGYSRPQDAAAGSGAVPDPVGTLRRLVIKIEEADNLVVIRTPPGSAQQVAIVLDSGIYPLVVGTIAGDDTCVVITRSAEDSLTFKTSLMAEID